MRSPLDTNVLIDADAADESHKASSSVSAEVEREAQAFTFAHNLNQTPAPKAHGSC